MSTSKETEIVKEDSFDPFMYDKYFFASFVLFFLAMMILSLIGTLLSL